MIRMKSLKEELKLNGDGIINYLKSKALRDYEGDDLLIFIWFNNLIVKNCNRCQKKKIILKLKIIF